MISSDVRDKVKCFCTRKSMTRILQLKLSQSNEAHSLLSIFITPSNSSQMHLLILIVSYQMIILLSMSFKALVLSSKRLLFRFAFRKSHSHLKNCHDSVAHSLLATAYYINKNTCNNSGPNYSSTYNNSG